MDVSAIAQATQSQQSATAQDANGGPAADQFAFLLENYSGNSFGVHAFNPQSVLGMVGNTPSYTPPPEAAAAPPPSANTGTTQPQTGQSASTTSAPAQSSTNTAGTAASNNNGSGGSGSGAQSNSGSSQDQQGSQQPNSGSPGASQTTTAATTTTAPVAQNVSGEDQATEETAAVLGAAVFLAQQMQTRTVTVEAVAQVAAAANTQTGAQQQSSGPVATPQAAQAAAPTRAIDVAQAADDTPDETPISSNFASSGPTTPEIAQQATNLAQITGQSGATVTVQNTTGDTGATSSTSALMADAVLAMPGFFAGGQQGASTDDGGDNQSNGPQNNDQPDPDSLLDPATLMLAQDVQAMSAIATLLQSGPQILVSAQQAAGASITATAATTAATTAAESALPQPTAPSSTATASTSFVSQLQEAEQPQAPQATTPTTLPGAVDQIKMQIEKGLQQGSTIIKVQLTPENLGRVEVKLDVQNGTVKATITADRPATLALLKSDQSGMLQALTDAGLNADSSSLSFYLRGDQQRQFAQSGRQGRNAAGNASADDGSTLTGVAAATGTSPATAAGTVDISV